MNRNDARKIAETITNDQLQQMFDNAKAGIKDWTETSICNIGLTKGVAWNILARNFDTSKEHHILAKINMVREFGEFLPGGLKPAKKPMNNHFKPVHRDPIFDEED